MNKIIGFIIHLFHGLSKRKKKTTGQLISRMFQSGDCKVVNFDDLFGDK